MNGQEAQAQVDSLVLNCAALLMEAALRAEAEDPPSKWDDEYAGHALDDVVDRLYCAPIMGLPKPTETAMAAYRAARAAAAPFLDEGTLLPGAVDRLLGRIVAWVAADDQSRLSEKEAERIVADANGLPDAARLELPDRAVRRGRRVIRVPRRVQMWHPDSPGSRVTVTVGLWRRLRLLLHDGPLYTGRGQPTLIATLGECVREDRRRTEAARFRVEFTR